MDHNDALSPIYVSITSSFEYILVFDWMSEGTVEDFLGRDERAGATFQDRVNGAATTVIVTGQPNPRQMGERAGTKLFDAYRRTRQGQRIAIINAEQFERLDRLRAQVFSNSFQSGSSRTRKSSSLERNPP